MHADYYCVTLHTHAYIYIWISWHRYVIIIYIFFLHCILDCGINIIIIIDCCTKNKASRMSLNSHEIGNRVAISLHIPVIICIYAINMHDELRNWGIEELTWIRWWEVHSRKAAMMMIIQFDCYRKKNEMAINCGTFLTYMLIPIINNTLIMLCWCLLRTASEHLVRPFRMKDGNR